MLKVGDSLPACTLQEFVDVSDGHCALGPNPLDLSAATSGKTIVIVGVPGAFTPTCSEKHLPAYVEQADAFKAAGIDEIWCLAVNDAFVMGAWGRALQTAGHVRMIADGSAAFTQATGLSFDLTARGLGIRCQRFSMVVVDGKVRQLRVEAPGKFEVSDAQSTLAAWTAA